MNRIARNVMFSMVAFAWPAALLLIATPVIVRHLGDEAYGVWMLVGNVVAYLSVFNSLQTAGTKYLAEYTAAGARDSVQKLLSTSLVFNLGVGLVGGGALFLCASPLAVSVFKIPVGLQAESITAFRLAGVGFCFGAIGWWAAGILAGLQRFDWLASVLVATTTASTLGGLLAAWSGRGVVGVVVANLAGTLLSVVVYACAVRRLLSGIEWRLDLDSSMFRRVLTYGLFSTMQVIFGIVAMQLDRTLLGVWIGVAAVAVYGVPASAATRIHQLCARALEVVFPISSALDAERRTDELKRLFLRAQNLNVVLVVMSSVPLLILAPEILTLWIGADFAAEATLVFRLLVVAYGILALNVVAAGVVAGLGHPDVNAAFAILLGLSNLVGYCLFIPNWGVDGAGVATLLGSAFSVPLWLWYVNHRFLQVPLSEVLGSVAVRPFLAGIAVAAVLLVARPLVSNIPLLLCALSGACLVYLAVTVGLKVWQPEELDLVRQLWKGVRRQRCP